jgi:HSP20 family protein
MGGKLLKEMKTGAASLHAANTVGAANFIRSFLMFFASTAPAHFRRFAYGSNGHSNGHVSRSLERFLDDAVQTGRQSGASFEQDDTSFTLSFDVPGVAKDQLTIGIEGNVVRITAKEGAPRQYKAAYELPQDIDPSGSDAKLDNGVLTLKLAKKVVVSPVSELAIH